MVKDRSELGSKVSKHSTVHNEVRFYMSVVIWLLISHTDAVSIRGISPYTILGTPFALICDVPEEADVVRFYRSPNDIKVGEVRVSISICYNMLVQPPISCPTSLCTCVPSDVNRGTRFVWYIQPQPEDHGSQWFCRRSNPDISPKLLDSDIYTIMVADPPSFLSLSPMETTYTKEEGEFLPDIVGTAANCRPDCDFVWTGPDNTNFLSSVLSLGQLDRSEHGTYTCTAFNEAGELSMAISVNVRYPSQIISLDYVVGGSDVPENETKTLVCSVESFPPSIIQWLYNETVLQVTIDVLESTYTLTNVSCLDTGVYTCSVQNDVSTQAVTMDIPINVLCKPRPDPRVETDYELEISSNETVLVVRAMFLSNPEPTYTWGFQVSPDTGVTLLIDGQDNFAINTSYTTNNLSAMSTGTRTDFGEQWLGVYIVTAENSQGSETLYFRTTGKDFERVSDEVAFPVLETVLPVTGAVILLIIIGIVMFVYHKPVRVVTNP
ncbi:carcinoembryonic antigen-related cell adhesion molecule 5-like [Argopecten irradians]|uniref:carcinoembryonic antigen-related cell adhesion molecule 5-like n=1 Tax=Argopecten irradians TaxID=31199 RepID=UPI003716A4FD